MKISGVSTVLRALRVQKPRNEKGIERGLIKAGLFLQRESQKIVPIDTGNLRGSAFTRKEGSGVRTQVLVGYTASYAIYVHENLEATHAPGKTAKFLEIPAREHRAKMIQIIRESAQQ